MHAELDRVVEAEWKITNDLQNAWVSWSAQQTRLEQTTKVVEALSSIVKSTNELAEQGELPKTEAALFSIELTNRRVELAGLKGELEAEEQEIRSLLGISPTAPIKLTPSLTVASLAASESRLAANNPTLNRLHREYEVSERTLLREIRKQYPDLQIGPQAQKEQGQSSIGFIGGIPLPILNANKGGIAKAKAERKVAQAAYETEYERKVGQLAALQARLRALRSQRSSIENDLIPLVDRQAADAEKLVQLGENGSLVLLESLTRAYEAKLKIIHVTLQKSQVETEIQRLLGPTNYKSKSSNK
jgi:outer membrane protein TolC